MRKDLFILVPSLKISGPVKGAIATANLLNNEFNILLISLKNCKNDCISPNTFENFKYISLGGKNLLNKFFTFRRLLVESKRRNGELPTSLSLCFSADLFNAFFIKHSINIASLRSNIFKDYFLLFGYTGYIICIIHLVALNFFKKVFVMSNSMNKSIGKYLLKKPEIIPNFIDENNLVRFRSSTMKSTTIKLVFVGSLSKRKQPVLLIDILDKLIKKNFNVNLTFIGNGPLLNELQFRTTTLGLSDKVQFTGFLADPYEIISKSDIFILPSIAEGTSRALLEALFLGLPCVVRDIENNNELILPELKNGALFYDDQELIDATIKVLNFYKINSSKLNLLPIKYRQENIKNVLLQSLGFYH